MIYTIDLSNYNNFSKKVKKASLKVKALSRLNHYSWGVSEKELDLYLKKTYNTTLWYICFAIINKCKAETDKDTITIYLNNKYLDKLARIITFGVGKTKGSRIIPYMFGIS